jgi:hypothetical protein
MILLWPEWPKNGDSIPGKGKILLTAQKYPSWPWSAASITLNGIQTLFIYTE